MNYIPDTREPVIVGDYCFILMACGKVAIIDASDYDLVKDRKWSMGSVKKNKNGIGIKDIGYPSTKIEGKSIKLHLLIFGDREPNTVVDHINRNRLDARRSNLRCCTVAENNRNAPSNKNSSSQYKGVRRSRNRWQVAIKHDKKTYHVGSFMCEIEAAKHYDKKAIELHGIYAKLNFDY